NGRMATGFQKLADGRIVYYNEEGQMRNGDVQMANGDWYYFDPANGNMAKGGLLLDKVSGTLKYFNNNGVRQSGIISIDGIDYTFDSKTGSLNITGAGEHKIGNHWYLMNDQNKLVTGFQKLADGRIVYYDPINAQLVNGERQIDGDWYYFNPSNGNMTIGFQKLPDGRIVYYNSQGRLQLGEQQIDGDWYYFNPSNGNMTIGFQVLPDGRTVYYNSQGRMAHGWFNANGSWGDWDVHYADYNNGQVHSMSYYSQFTPIYAPEGCGAASLGMLLSGEGKYPGLRTLYNNLPQYGGVYSSANFRGPVTPDALAAFGRNWDSNLQSVSGYSINQLADLVASGHPVLYYGWSLYEGAYQGKGNHIKVMLGYHNGYFHIYDPCYNSYWEGSHHYGIFDYGANSWQSIGKVASEYRGWAVSSL
ncbi:C39 family peptidase, partial [Lactobacillaceae bacterium 24-114]